MYVDKKIFRLAWLSVFRCRFRFWYPMDCPSKSIMKTLYPPWLNLVVHQWLFCPTKVFLGKWTNFLKFLTSCLAKGDYAPSFPTEKFGQNGENYSPLHYLNHNRYYRGEGGRMLRTTIFHHTSIVMCQFSEIVFFPSNHTIHKSSCDLCFWASVPLVERFL